MICLSVNVRHAIQRLWTSGTNVRRVRNLIYVERVTGEWLVRDVD